MKKTKTLYLSDEALDIIETKENKSKYVSDLIVNSEHAETMASIINDIDEIKEILNKLLIEKEILGGNKYENRKFDKEASKGRV